MTRSSELLQGVIVGSLDNRKQHERMRSRVKGQEN